jgi:TonB family protein
MSNMTVCVDNSVPPRERRIRLRHPLGALAYLDIGADNGGIILNVSEEGLALQAVGPLEQQKDINLRIQLPHSETRIETAARIVWLSPSNRQAGVRFVAMPAASRAQIQQWMQSQPAPGASEADSGDASKTAGPLAPSAEPVQNSQREKWLSLMADFEARQSAATRAEPAASAVPPQPAPVVPPLPHPKPEIVSREFGKRKQQGPNTPAINAALARAAYAKELPPGPKKPEPVLASSTTSKIQTPSSNIPESAVLTRPSGLLAKIGIDTTEAARNAMRRAAERTANRTRSRNQIAAVAAIVLFSVLFFGIGTWVGRLINRQPSSHASATPAPVATPTESNPVRADTSSKPNEELALSSSGEKRSERTHTPSAVAARKHSSARSLGPVVSASAQQPRQNTVSVPLAGNPPPVRPVQSIQNAYSVQPSPVDFVPQPPSPGMVDGRVLKPSDRFNPCHLTYRVEPTYPPEAQTQGIQGTVTIHLVIAPDGSVRSEKLVSGPSQLASAALDATKYWRYFPALLNGEPVQTEKDVEVAFRLPR